MAWRPGRGFVAASGVHPHEQMALEAGGESAVSQQGLQARLWGTLAIWHGVRVFSQHEIVAAQRALQCA